MREKGRTMIPIIVLITVLARTIIDDDPEPF
jgi:hypothetical protein